MQQNSLLCVIEKMNCNDKDIIEGCKHYDKVWQKALYDKYSAKLYAICRRYHKNKEDAEDVFQDAFIKLLSSVEKYSGIGSFEGWLRRFFTNYCINSLRNKTYKEQLNDEIFTLEENEEENLDVERFTNDELMSSLSILKDLERMIFNMAEVEQMSYKEIEQLLKIKAVTLRSINFRAKKKLKEYLLNIERERNE